MDLEFEILHSRLRCEPVTHFERENNGLDNGKEIHDEWLTVDFETNVTIHEICRLITYKRNPALSLTSDNNIITYRSNCSLFTEVVYLN